MRYENEKGLRNMSMFKQRYNYLQRCAINRAILLYDGQVASRLWNFEKHCKYGRENM